MPRRPHVPPMLTKGPFRSRDGLAAGLTPDQLRSACWRRLSRDVYCHADLAVTDELRLQAALLSAPEHAVVTGLTAAWLYGVWRPAPGADVPLEFATRNPDGAYCSGLRAARLQLDPGDVTDRDGVLITTPERTCFDLMRRDPLFDAVAHADAFQHVGLTTRDALEQYGAARPRWPGIRTVRTAVRLSSPRAESRMESRLRMVILAAGLPLPFVNVAIYDEAGRALGRPDLHYLGPPLGIEYDGSYHDDPAQRERDDERENRLLVGRVPLLRYGSRAVYQTPERIVTDVLAMRPDFAPLTPPAWARAR